MGDAVHHGQYEKGGCVGACVFDGTGGDRGTIFFFETGHGIWGTRRHCANEKGEKPRLRITQTYLGSRFFVLQCKG